MIHLVLCSAFLLSVKASLLPSYIDKSCASGNIAAAANNVIPLLLSGDPNYNLQNYLPYRETQRALLNTGDGYFVLNNDRLYGLDSVNVLDIAIDFDSSTFVGVYNFHRLVFLFSYFINIYNTSLTGAGPGKLRIDNINVTQTFNFANDSVGHVFLLDATCTYSADDIVFDLKNLDSDASQYLEDNHDYFTELIRPQLQRTLSAILTSPIAAIFELVRMDDLFNFNC